MGQPSRIHGRIWIDRSHRRWRQLLLSGLLLTGCSISATPYAVHPDTIVALRSHAGHPVKLAPFTSDKPGKSEIMCRLVGLIQTPGGVPFEQYVENAFRAELLVAGLLSDAAPVTLSGHLERMHFSTASEAVWEVRVTLVSSNGRRLTVADEYPFNWHFIADYACREAATAMVLAVQSLVRKAVQHPEFAGLLVQSSALAASPPAVATPAAAAPPQAASPAAPALQALVPVRPEDLRQWVPGKWRSAGGTNTLTIERDLTWSWGSSFGGRWNGSGRGEIRDGRLILEGWHSTSIPMMLKLKREGNVLVGELQTSRSYAITFERE